MKRKQECHEKSNKKEMLMDATMQIVAERSLVAFSMRQVTQAIGVSEVLIYRHYEAKENLLFQCFQNIDQQITNLFINDIFPTAESEQKVYEYIYCLWVKYFNFLIQNGYKTLYYFEYKDSVYYESFMASGKYKILQTQIYFKRFIDIFYIIDKKYHVFDKVTPDLL